MTCARKWLSIDPSKEEYRQLMKLRRKLRSAAHHHRRRQRIGFVKSDINTDFLLELWNKTNICEECSEIMEEHCRYPLGRNLDHIIRLCDGGLHLQNNVRYIHAICNGKRNKGKKQKNSQKILET